MQKVNSSSCCSSGKIAMSVRGVKILPRLESVLKSKLNTVGKCPRTKLVRLDVTILYYIRRDLHVSAVVHPDTVLGVWGCATVLTSIKLTLYPHVITTEGRFRLYILTVDFGMLFTRYVTVSSEKNKKLLRGGRISFLSTQFVLKSKPLVL